MTSQAFSLKSSARFFSSSSDSSSLSSVARPLAIDRNIHRPSPATLDTLSGTSGSGSSCCSLSRSLPLSSPSVSRFPLLKNDDFNTNSRLRFEHCAAAVAPAWTASLLPPTSVTAGRLNIDNMSLSVYSAPFSSAIPRPTPWTPALRETASTLLPPPPPPSRNPLPRSCSHLYHSAPFSLSLSSAILPPSTFSSPAGFPP
mmetsp:Transcript_4396/g.13324  ORF Transcript_4396/g.13324 Transcript_4396/m.13324 type:complete len:200 (-) Transcript_4396:19-618(-)